MPLRRRLLRPVSIHVLAILAGAGGAACGQEPVDREALPSEQAAALQPFLEVEVDERWRALAAYNPRSEGPAVERTETLPDGNHTLWHANGVKKGEGRFERGRKQGPWTWWYESGQKRWEGSYVDDRPAGLERSWFENGELEYEGSFENDQREGPWQRFHDNGQPAVRGTYVDGLRQGEFRYWSYEGELDRERSGLYERDVKVAELPE